MRHLLPAAALCGLLLLGCRRADPDAEAPGPIPILKVAEGSRARGALDAGEVRAQAVVGSADPAAVRCRYDAAAGECTVTAATERATTFRFSLGGEGALELRGAAPSAACLKANAVAVGTQWPCSRRTLISGDCERVAWELSGFDPSLPGCP